MAKMTLDIGAASRPCPGFVDNGDKYVVDDLGWGLLVSAIDGLGHGREASKASDAAVACLRRCRGDAVDCFHRRCHEELRGTRGVVAGVAVIDYDSELLRFAGVGNIEARVYASRPAETLISGYGVVGHGNLPRIRIRETPFPPGAILVMLSDGISLKFDLDAYYGLREQGAQFIADVLLRDWGRTNDDATVVVVRRED